VANAAGKQPELHKRPPLSERALAARRMNALKGGRPKGSMNADKLAFRDRFRAKEVELADNLINLALHGKTEQIRLAATERCIDRGWGRPSQPHDGDGQGGPIALMVFTGVPEPDAP
jgi:hypothetical protein